MKKNIIFIFFFVNALLFANQVEIVNLPLAKSLSLASETALVNNRVFSVLTNPAILYKIDYGYRLEYNKFFYYANTEYDLFGLSVREQEGNVGFIFGRFSSGDLKVRNIEGIETGEVVEYSLSIIACGFSSKIISTINSDFYLGLGGYGIFEKINIESQYWGGNVGVIYEQRLNNKLFKYFSVGAVLRGWGMNNNLLHNEAISFDIDKFKVIFGYENYFPKRNTDKFKLGFSINIYNSKDDTYKTILDLGYSFGSYNESFSFGFEIKIKNILLNYSFSKHSYLNNLHNVLLSLKL